MALPPGTRLGAFEITGLIGVGGMGEVYRARDAKLGREVALKVLPEAFAEDRGRLGRFEREAKVLASLDHPNIAALYDFQEQAGIRFLVMQLIEGESLAEKISRGPLPVREALTLFVQVAEALEAAHEKGIVHRDLKPANIKISEHGVVKVLDFGLAKPLHPSGTDWPTELSSDSAIVGTPCYMSPEQASGEQVDSRADVWAFGCCLYETLTGARPFQGETVFRIVAALLEEEPDMTKLPGQLPETVRSLLRGCFEKEPHRRLRDMTDIAISLDDTAVELRHSQTRLQPAAPGSSKAMDGSGRRLRGFLKGASVLAAAILGVLATVLVMRGFEKGGQAPTSIPEPGVEPIRGIAVLPFDNLSGDPEQEYFVDGMTDALTAELGKIKALKVISRTSAMRYKGLDKRASEVAKELDVDAVIEGSVYKAGDDVRITALLSDGTTDEHLWSDNYTGTLTNIIELQGEVTLAIAREIEVVVTPEERARIARTETVNPEAYDAGLKGLFFFSKYTPQGFSAAIEYAQQAIELDPDYAEAYAGLSIAYWVPSSHGYGRPSDAFPKAKDAATQALRLDEDLSLAHCTVGWIALAYDWDWRKAEDSLERALELSPNEPSPYAGLAWHSVVSGDYGDAIEMMERAIKLDPLWLQFSVDLGNIYKLSGQSEHAMAQYEKVLNLEPGFVSGLDALAWTHALLGNYREAISCVEKAMSLVGRTPGLAATLAYAYARSDRRDEAEELLQQLHHREKDGEYVQANHFATVYVALGDSDEAFTWLERAYEEREWVMVLLKSEAIYRELRSDPRFDDLLERMKFPD